MMWIVAIAWIYVVGLMALTEVSVVAGIMTFLGYCVLPLSLVYYLAGTKRRKRRNAATQPAAPGNSTTPTDSDGTAVPAHSDASPDNGAHGNDRAG